MSLDPSTKASAFAVNTATFFKVDALKGGTESMRAAGETLLPKNAEELPANYQTRLANSTLVNYYNKALDNAIGRAFQKPITVQNLPAALTPYLKDIDGTGSTIDQFGQEALWNTAHHGTNYLVVDYPHVEVLPVTKADQATNGARPYIYSIEAPQVLAAYSVVDGGQERLAYFRWISTEVIPSEDFLTETLVNVVKAYAQPVANGPITLTTWKKNDNGWEAEAPVEIIGVDEIPVVCPYGWRTGFFIGKPVLMDLADLNVAHWDSLSKQTHILSIARVPFLHAAGDNLSTTTADDKGRTTVTPFKLSIHSAAVTGKDTIIKWVETEGKSIDAGQKYIDYLEAKMDQQSLTMSTSAPGDATATATAINAAEAHSVLKALCVSFEQALTKALFFMSQFAGSPAPTVAVKLDLSVDVPTAQASPTATDGTNTAKADAPAANAPTNQADAKAVAPAN